MIKVEKLNLLAKSPKIEYPSESLYSSLKWNSAFSDSESYIHIAYQNNQIVGALTSHFLPNGSPNNNVYDAAYISGAVDVSKWRPQIILGARNGQFNSLNINHLTSPEDRQNIVRAMVASAIDDRDVCASFFYLDFTSAQTIYRALPEFIPYLTELDSTIPFSGRSFDEYLQLLSSKRRYDIRRELKRAGGPPKIVSGSECNVRFLTACAELAATTQARHGQYASPEGMFKYLQKCMIGVENSYISYYGSYDRPRAFSLALVYNRLLWVRLVGLTYDMQGGTNGEYQGVLIYGPILIVAQNGLEGINIGAGVHNVKRRHGAIQEARWTLLKPRFGFSIDNQKIDSRNQQEAMRLGVEQILSLEPTEKGFNDG